MKILTDFTAGELSRKFIGRPDLAVYQRGALEITNGVPFFPGGVTSRPGFEWIGTIGNTPTRLRAFTISETISYLLEFTALKIRIWRNGALLQANNAPLEITTVYANIGSLQFAQDANKLFIASGVVDVCVLEMTATDTFSFHGLAITGNAGQVPFVGSGNYPKAIAIHDGCLWLAETANDPQMIWRSRPFDYGNFTYWDTITSTSKQLREPMNPFTGTLTENSDVITGIAAEEIAKLKLGDTIFGAGIPYDYPDTITRIQSIGESSIVIDKSASATGTYTIYSSWYDRQIPEYEEITTTRDVITADCAFRKPIASDINESILWLASGSDLIVGTTCGERVIPSGVNVANFICRRQTANGSARIQPVLFMNAVVFAGANRKSLYNYTYKGLTKESQAYDADRIDLQADHILAGTTQLEYSSTGMKILWAPQEDGELIGCVIERQAEIAAFFRVSIPGAAVESVAVVPEGGEDILYAAINRGGTRSLQRLGAIFGGKNLDEYATKTVAARAVTGISWITGTATILHNGKAYQVTVAGGAATVPDEIPDGATVTIGRKFTTRIKTLPTSQNPFKKKQIPKATVRVLDSYPFKIGYETDLATTKIDGPYSGDVDVQIGGGWDTEGCLVIEQEALPVTILAIALDINNGG